MKVKVRENQRRDVLRLIHKKENIAHLIVSQYSHVAESVDNANMHQNEGWDGHNDITETGFLLDETGHYISSRQNIEWWKEVLLLYQVYLDKYNHLKEVHGEEKVLHALKKSKCVVSGIENTLKHKIKVLESYFSKEEAPAKKSSTVAKIWNS